MVGLKDRIVVMQVLKIIAEGLVTSFRYPHFVQQVHLTFEMPPPATIYGHVCSAVGDYIERDLTSFAYHFTYTTKFVDYEHLHFFGAEPKMNPFERELIFEPRMTLYLGNVDLEPYFRSPHYAVILGRAQDLFTYVRVDVVDLQPAPQTFFEHTLLPLAYAAELGGRSFAVTMPRFIDENRRPEWEQYAVLQSSVVYPGPETLTVGEGAAIPIWVDPEPDAAHPSLPLQRGIIWHDWVERGHETSTAR